MKRLPWFRLWYEARNDRKLATLEDDEHRCWFGLLCMAAENSNRGEVDASDLDLLALEVSRADVELLERTIERLIRLKIAEKHEGMLVFLHWMERQYDKPSDYPEATAARKAAQRSRDKEKLGRDPESCHADVTPSHAESRDVTPSHALEEKRGEEKREGNSNKLPDTSTPAPDDDEPELPTLKPLTQFTEFRLSTAHYQIAESLYGWDRAETKRNTEAWKISRRKKRDHAVSDYNADWQGYLDARYRIDQKDAKASSNGNGRPERLPDAGIWILPSNVERPQAAGPDYKRVSVNGYVDWFPPDKLPAGAKEWRG